MIKYIALLSMTIDHVNLILFDRSLGSLIGELGRIAYPLFLYMLVRNYMNYTKSKEIYILRLLIAGAVSLPFTYYAYSHLIPLNIFFSLGFAALLIYSIEKRYLFLGVPLILYSMSTEYGIGSLVLTLAFMLMYVKPKEIHYTFFIVAAAAYILNGMNEYLYVFVVMLLVIHDHYREKKIEKRISRSSNRYVNNIQKYVFYVYYPLHLVVIKLLS